MESKPIRGLEDEDDTKHQDIDTITVETSDGVKQTVPVQLVRMIHTLRVQMADNAKLVHLNVPDRVFRYVLRYLKLAREDEDMMVTPMEGLARYPELKDVCTGLGELAWIWEVLPPGTADEPFTSLWRELYDFVMEHPVILNADLIPDDMDHVKKGSARKKNKDETIVKKNERMQQLLENAMSERIRKESLSSILKITTGRVTGAQVCQFPWDTAYLDLVKKGKVPEVQPSCVGAEAKSDLSSISSSGSNSSSSSGSNSSSNSSSNSGSHSSSSSDSKEDGFSSSKSKPDTSSSSKLGSKKEVIAVDSDDDDQPIVKKSTPISRPVSGREKQSSLRSVSPPAIVKKKTIPISKKRARSRSSSSERSLTRNRSRSASPRSTLRIPSKQRSRSPSVSKSRKNLTKTRKKVDSDSDEY